MICALDPKLRLFFALSGYCHFHIYRLNKKVILKGKKQIIKKKINKCCYSCDATDIFL